MVKPSKQMDDVIVWISIACCAVLWLMFWPFNI